MVTLASQLFSKADQLSEDEEQLLKLFWNRADLKKRLDRLRNENYTLVERVRQEEALKLRVQQRLEQLETLLANPATAANAITYYQLRDIWHRCHARLTSISAELAKLSYDQGYRLHVASFRRKLYKSLSSIQRELNEVNHAGELLSNQILALRELRSKRTGFWNFFSRRRLTAEINTKRSKRREITMRLGELTEDMQYKSTEAPPDYGGLDVITKRSVNLTVIAYAQELYLHFADRGLAEKAREAAIRKVSDVRYGDRRDCRELSAWIEDRIAGIEADAGLPGRVQDRVRHLESVISYRRDSDTVPGADFLGVICLFRPDGQVRGEVSVNVLADEYWDVFSALQN